MHTLSLPFLFSHVGRLAASGLLVALIAAYAHWADRRRFRRTRLDAVGFMPWTTIFIMAMFAAVLLFGFAVRAWFAG